MHQSSGIPLTDKFRSIPVSIDPYGSLGLFVDRDDMTWSCGNYVLYDAHQHLPEYDQFWMMEYDVIISRPGRLLRADRLPVQGDFLASYLRPAETNWHWITSLQGQFRHVYRCFFPLVRIAARAVDFLFDLQANDSRFWSNDMEQDGSAWPNDEAFAATLLQNGGCSCADLNQFGAAYTEDSFSWHKPSHLSALPPHDGRLYYPVRTGQSYLHVVNQHQTDDPALLTSLIGRDRTARKAGEPLALPVAWPTAQATRLSCSRSARTSLRSSGPTHSGRKLAPSHGRSPPSGSSGAWTGYGS